MVTAKRIWQALGEIPDPEIPVVSLVDLGVVRDVQVDADRVRVEFTPTFSAVPALEVMRDAMAASIAELGAEPDVITITDDSWSTDRITPAGREKLRQAGFAPPTPRAAGERPTSAPERDLPLPVLRVDRHALENIFGPTPCRSIRYCNACRQPYEHFKTL